MTSITENEAELYRKIAVWRSRGTFLLFPILATIPLMLLAHFQWAGEDAETALGMLVFLDLLLYLPYAVCVLRLATLTADNQTRSILRATALLPPLFIFFSLGALASAWKVLRNAGYTVGFFRTDWSQFSTSSTIQRHRFDFDDDF